MYQLSNSQQASLQALQKRKEFQPYTFETNFTKQANIQCPRCQKEFPIVENELQEIGSFNVHVFRSQNLAIPYMLCKLCSHRMNTEPPVLRSQNNQKIDRTLLEWLKKHRSGIDGNATP